MSLHHPIAEWIVLAIVVLACWLGVIGMLRMKEPTQSLHYLSLPAVATIALIIGVFLQTGLSEAAWKTVAIAIMLLAVNSVVTHATARAFRTRDLGHWEPLDGDPIEFVRDTKDSQS